MVITIHISPSLLREVSDFVKLVREYNNGALYDPFNQIIQDYDQQRIDYYEASSRVGELFNGHIQLVELYNGLNKEFILNYYHAKLWDRFAINDNQRYLNFFEILRGYRSGQKSMQKMVEELAINFAGHMDLFLEFCAFLPRD
ncbi:paired amphipathic helix protein Sin3-like 1 isoform X1 [Corylus avellana]|uniref:paired amphipathic helix protein Sin3-like 1 isoform X1 n=1 Tax=Corylus avellana TaxID=13451 RepID=UPI00286B15A6|nr:paired amphipathic helix protein Sin3-like 1 isoform X1 [Corylus avellana]XP_059444627.1 paired amphipathic helix protein Sin3-like 1 isoform X1 [Corylus avellana]